MNRGQIKRVRKELERLQNSGKEWEALRFIEQSHAIDEFRAEWDNQWRSQARHALRTGALMDQFLLRVTEFSTVPDTADIRFIRAVGEYLDGGELTCGVTGMTGLSAPAEALRRELLRRGDEPVSSDMKLRKLLTSCAITPESVLQKEYRQLCSQLSSYPAIAQGTCEKLGELLTRSRKLNSASAIKNKLHGVAEDDLKSIDAALKKLGAELPRAFFRVVAAPVLAQVCISIRRIAELNPDKGARLALIAPFCLECVAGPSWQELRDKFQLEAAQTFTATDRASLRKAALNATFEERFVLVNRLVRIMTSQNSLDENLQDTLVILIKAIFKELAVRRTNISDRDQRKLAAVFGSFFSKNMDVLYGSEEDLPFLLDSAAAVGCLDPVSALMHAFFAVVLRDRAMIANARSMLRLLPPMQAKDVGGFFRSYQTFLCDDLKALKGTLDICRECGHELDLPVADNLAMSLLTALVMSTLLGGGERNSLLSMVMGSMPGESAAICKKLIKGMECFTGNPLYSVPAALASAFPVGRISGTQLGQYLQQQISASASTEKPITEFVIMLGTISQASKALQMDMPFGDMLNSAALIKELLGAGLSALCDKREMIVRHSTDSLAKLVDVMLIHGYGSALERSMLLISSVAAERKLTGDETAGKLHKKTMDYLASIVKPSKRGGRRR